MLRIHFAALRHLRRILVLPTLWLAVQTAAHAAPAPSPAPGSDAANGNGRLILVLPFENLSTQPGLDWIGASFPTLLDARLRSAGDLTIGRQDRIYAMQHLDLPANANLTHATIYKVAQMLDADAVILGSYSVANGTVTATAHVLQMHSPRMDGPLTESAPLDKLLDIEDGLAWQAARIINPQLSLTKESFLNAGHSMRLDTLENYMRGEIEPGAEERIRHLAIAVQLSPDYAPARLALGMAYFSNQQYNQAMDTLAQVPAPSAQAPEAEFYTGLAGLYTGQYAKAETAFSTLAASLPLAEVLNDQGIALNRENQDGTALIARAAQLNPQNENLWFNLAVSQRRTHADKLALESVRKALALRPDDTDAQQLQQHLLVEIGQAPPATAAATSDAAASDAETDSSDDSDAAQSADAPETSGASGASDAAKINTPYEPLERIARSYNEASFRQAAFELKQLRARQHAAPAPAPQEAPTP